MNDPERNRKTLAALARLEVGPTPARSSDHMKAIARRIEFLRQRIETQGASPGAIHFYRAELSALRWAHKKLTATLAAERAARALGNAAAASAEPPMREAA
jgi:hypothetical protein